MCVLPKRHLLSGRSAAKVCGGCPAGEDLFVCVRRFIGQPVFVVDAVKYDHEQPVVKESLEMPVAGGESEPEFSGEFAFGDAVMWGAYRKTNPNSDFPSLDYGSKSVSEILSYYISVSNYV